MTERVPPSERVPPTERVPPIERVPSWLAPADGLGADWSGRRRRPRHVAFVLALMLAFFEVVGTLGAAAHQHGDRNLDALAILLIVAGSLALTWLRCSPALVIGFEVAVVLAYLARGYAYGPVIIAPALAIFVAVVMGHRLAAWLGFWFLYGGHLAVREFVLDQRNSWGELFAVAAWGLVILLAAEAVRVRRERMAVTFAARREARRREANEERLRIARELHDVVAHHMSLINVQASVALHLVDRRPEQVQTALEVIKDASKEALSEMRSLVGILRDEAETAPRAPAAMLDSLDDLVERSALAGLTLRKQVTGEVVALPAAVELAAFRIIQEAVTNVVRHSGADVAEVTLDYRPDELMVRVADNGRGLPGAEGDGPPVPEDATGSGLRGMQERAAALGGMLTLGRAALGGASVQAFLPLEPRR